MRIHVWAVLVGIIGASLAIPARWIGLAAGFGISGALSVLLGTFVLIGDQCRWFKRLFNRVSPRWGAIESGMDKLCGDSSKKDEPKWLEEGDRGFKEILKIIAERKPDLRPAGISGILRGSAMVVRSGEGSVAQEYVALRRSREDPPNALASKEALERWIRDARVRSLSHLGFAIVLCGIALGLVSMIIG